MNSTQLKRHRAARLESIEAMMSDQRERQAAARASGDDEALKDATGKLEFLQEEQLALLKTIDPHAVDPEGRPLAGGDGYRRAAQLLDLQNGRARVELEGASMIRPMMAAVGAPASADVRQLATHIGLQPGGVGQDRRYLYPAFPRGELDPGEMAISDFRQIGARKAATAAASTDLVTSNGHGYADGERVVFLSLTGGAGLTAGTTYYVRDSTTNTFKIAATAGGSAIDITTNYSAATVLNYESLGRTVTGSVERDPLATTEKAKVDVALEFVTDAVRQFAAIVDEVPSKLFDIENALEAFLRGELMYQLERGLDAHVVAKILAAAPLTGSVGSDLIAKTRNAIAAMHDVGAEPSVLAVSPTDAAALDLTKTTDGLYIFLTRETGAASPMWSLRIREVAGLASPIVIDPQMLGVLYPATGRMLADPYTGLSTNEVRVRAEFDGLFHVRNANGAYVIA